jgi:hypothetical protein
MKSDGFWSFGGGFFIGLLIGMGIVIMIVTSGFDAKAGTIGARIALAQSYSNGYRSSDINSFKCTDVFSPRECAKCHRLSKKK